MTPILIGYFPKRTMKRPDWLRVAGVEEVCSVSTCLSHAPDGWIDQWRHNELWVYDTPELAWSVVPAAVRQQFDLYAYKIFPVVFREGQQHPFQLPALHVQPDWNNWNRAPLVPVVPVAFPVLRYPLPLDGPQKLLPVCRTSRYVFVFTCTAATVSNSPDEESDSDDLVNHQQAGM